MKLLNVLNKLIDDIDDHHNYEIIFGGDFNFIFDAELDSDGGNPKPKYFSTAASQSLCDMLDILADSCDMLGILAGSCDMLDICLILVTC